MKKIILAVTACLVMSLALTSCDMSMNITDESEGTPEPTMSAELRELTQNTVDATIELENGDEINLELYPDLAPETVANFISLADDGFYDGTIFHRVIKDFMIQGGGYDEDLNELKADKVDGEFASNGFENELSHTRGVISMARAQDYDSASSQFFIVQEDATYLDGDYAAFGRVTDDESLDVVDDIASVKTGTESSAGLSDVPITPIVIKTVKINAGSSSLLDDDDDKDSHSKTDKDTDKTDTAKDKSTPKASEEINEEELEKLFDSADDAKS